MIDIKDDFLPEDLFADMQQALLDSSFPWFYYDHVTRQTPSGDDFQFVHVFYNRGMINSDYYRTLILPVLDHLGAKALRRAKANLLCARGEQRLHGFHTDFLDCAPGDQQKVSILYITDSDAPTVFQDGQQVFPRPNRLLTFPAHLAHSSTSPQSQRRVVINVNWF